MEKRIKEIESRFTAFKKETYQKKEVLTELFKLQDEIVRETFNSEHAEKGVLHVWDVERHFEQINETCGHVADELMEDFKIQSKALCEMISAKISGSKGEAKAYKCLQTIARKHRLLKNIELKQKDHRTELDIIAVTNRAAFIVEVKNTSKDIVIDEKGNYCRVVHNGDLVLDKNIGENMNEKEFLLREVLRTAGIEDVPIRSLLVFTNSSINVVNNYEYIQKCFLSQLPHIIDNDMSGIAFDEKKMLKIEQAILDAQCKESYPVELDVKKFKETFATLLATLECAKKKQIEIEEIEAKNKENRVFKFFGSIAKVACSIFN